LANSCGRPQTTDSTYLQLGGAAPEINDLANSPTVSNLTPLANCFDLFMQLVAGVSERPSDVSAPGPTSPPAGDPYQADRHCGEQMLQMRFSHSHITALAQATALDRLRVRAFGSRTSRVLLSELRCSLVLSHPLERFVLGLVLQPEDPRFTFTPGALGAKGAGRTIPCRKARFPLPAAGRIRCVAATRCFAGPRDR
jgi:hypothetical protein